MKYAILGTRNGVLRVVDNQPPEGRIFAEITNEQADQISQSEGRFFYFDGDLIPMREWLENHRWENNQWVEFVPPVPPSVTPRQFRLALIDTGILPTQIESALNNIEDEIEKAKALTEWEYALSFDRSHSLIVAIADQLNVSEEDIDDLFRKAAKI